MLVSYVEVELESSLLREVLLLSLLVPSDEEEKLFDFFYEDCSVLLEHFDELLHSLYDFYVIFVIVGTWIRLHLLLFKEGGKKDFYLIFVRKVASSLLHLNIPTFFIRIGIDSPQ